MQTYSVPKESDSPSFPAEKSTGEAESAPSPLSPSLPPGHPAIGNDMSMANAAAQGVAPPSASKGDVTWVVPHGWEEKPGSGFRYATFVVPGEGSLAGDLSVTVLDGEAGGLLSNVNRWRGQIGLSDLTEGQLPGASKTIRPAGRAMTFVSFVSSDNLIDGKYKKRLMAAVYTSQGKTWFFKLIGEDRLVRSAEGDVLKFLGSLKGL